MRKSKQGVIQTEYGEADATHNKLVPYLPHRCNDQALNASTRSVLTVLKLNPSTPPAPVHEGAFLAGSAPTRCCF